MPPNDISQDTPLRLEDAVKAGFPAGGMTIKGLRREISKGRLEVELIAGKHFTTLAAIARMRELCRVVPKSPAVGLNGQNYKKDTTDAAAAQARLAAYLQIGRAPSKRSKTSKAKR